MRKIIILLFFIIHLAGYSVEPVSRVDSLSDMLTKTTGTQWIDCALLLAEEHRHINPKYGQSLLDDAISYSQKYNYSQGLADGNYLQGLYQLDNNKATTALTFFNQSYLIFKDLDLPADAAESMYNIANGLSRLEKPYESIDTLKYLLHHYRNHLPKQRIADIYILMSTNYNELFKFQSAISYIDSAIIFQEKNFLTKTLGNSYNRLGILYQDLGDYKNALKAYDKFEQISYETNDTTAISYATHNKAIIYMEWGAYDESLDLFLKSLSLSQELGMEMELTTTLNNIALVYQQTKDFSKAKFYYYEALSLANSYNQEEEKSIVLHNLGELSYLDGKYDSALILLNQSLSFDINASKKLGAAETYAMIATVYVAQGKFPLAFDYFNQAEITFESFGSKTQLANLYLEMGKAHKKINNDSLSVQFLRKSIEISSQINSIATLIDGYKELSVNYESLGKFETALVYYKKYDLLQDSIFSLEASSRRDYLSLKLENQEREKLFDRLTNEKKMMALENKTRTIYLTLAILALVLILAFVIIIYLNNRKATKITKLQNKELLASEQKNKALLDASFDSTILVDLDGKVRTANTNNLNGYLPDFSKLINSQLINLFSPTNQKILQNYMDLVISSKVIKEIQITEVENRIFNLKISPILDGVLEVGSVAFYIQDVTQIEADKKARQKMEEQLIQSQKLDTIGTLAGGIAHDLNNFLGTIKGYLEMSLEDINDPGQRIHRYLSSSLKATNQSQLTIKKLLTFSRGTEIELEKVNLDDLLVDCHDIILGSKPKDILLEFPGSVSGAIILGDANQLTQVIVNIVTNAFHAIVKENGLVKVEILKNHNTKYLKDSISTKNTVTIKISDNGFGMDSITMKRIFEPFFTTKEVGKGTGLGLSMARGIIKKHNGNIEVESELGIGSIFYINLPLIS